MSLKKIPVTVNYASPGAQPPVYLAGSFSDWHPEEMEFTTDANDEHLFKKEVMVEEGGVFQYKFRIGEGDWWVLNEQAPTVTDELGNRNNLLTAPVSEQKLTESLTVETSAPAGMEEPADSSVSEVGVASKGGEITECVDHKEVENTKPTLWKSEEKTEEPASDPIPSEIASKDEDADVPHDQNQAPAPPAADNADTPPAAIVETLSALPVPVATSGPAYESVGESSGSETILTPQTPLSVQDEKSEPEDRATTEELHERTPTPPRAHTPVPELIVEKVDDEPRHGDDFGSDATSGQREAHKMRAQDAEPDHVIVKPEMSPESDTAAEVADTAAELDKADPPAFDASAVGHAAPSTQTPDEIASEVADSAAIIDKEEPEPLSPDEEAGRTGERRLSHTPIPEVARTASEVADTAAMLDSDNFKIDMPRFKFMDPESGSASGTATPVHEKAPLFAHECPEPYEEDLESSPLPDFDQDHPSQSYEDEEAVMGQDDPLLENFPSDRNSILHTVRSCETRLDADETHFNGSPSSPVVGRNDLAVDRDLEEPPSASLDTRSNVSAQPSPILDMIKEEQNLPDDELPPPSLSSASGSELVEKPLPSGTKVTVEQIEETATPAKLLGKEDLINESPLDIKSSDTPSFIKQPEVTKTETGGDVLSSETAEEIVQPEDYKSGTQAEPDSLKATQEIENVEDGKTDLDLIRQTVEEPVIEEAEVAPAHTQTETSAKHVADDGETFVKNVGAEDHGPEIVIQPATPGISNAGFTDIDTAKSTSTETDTSDKSNVQRRNQASSKRTSTPTSLSSPHKEQEARNIFEAIWRTVFVSWIGGLITRLCGGGRRPLVAVTIVVLTLAPAIYFRVA